jgi:hypothetical protein
MTGHKVGVSDHQPIRCVLEMTEDSEIAVIVEPGCSVDDVHDMLRILMRCGGHFEHLTITDPLGCGLASPTPITVLCVGGAVIKAMQSDRWISCRDPIGRERSVIVVSDRCGTVMISPPGEVAVLSDDNVDALCSALQAARQERHQ